MGQYGWAGNETALGKTTSADVRRIIASQYVNAHNNPLIGGGEVSGRADMAYAYAAGVGVLSVADGAVLLTWPAGVTALVAPSPVAITHLVYCDADGAIRVAPQGQVNESQVIVLRRMRAPAAMNATSQATPVGDRIFAMPFGANLGWLAMSIDPRPQDEPVPVERHVWRQLTFAVPTDRSCEIQMHQCVYGSHNSSAPSTDFSNFGVGSMMYWAYVDNTLLRQWELEYNRIHNVRAHYFGFEVNEGEHVLRIERAKQWGSANPLNFGSPDNVWQPASVGIHDEGVWE